MCINMERLEMGFSEYPEDSKLKRHFKKRRTLYMFVGGVILGVTIAGVTYLIMRNNNHLTSLSGRVSDQLALAGDQKNVVSHAHVTNSRVGDVINNYNIKRLSYIVSQDGTYNWWRSQADAARELGISPSRISDHINRGARLENGVFLTRQGIAQ